MSKKKIVVVGFGFMGQNHSRHILNNSDLSLAGIVDAIDPKIALGKSAGNIALDALKVEQIADVPYFTDLQDAISSVKPDAVVVATPTMFHYKYAMTVLENGCSLFLEKPICLDTAQCDEMVALAKKKNVIFMAGHCVRFSPEFLYLKKVVDEGSMGAVQYAHFSRYSGVPRWGCWTDPKVSATSGGALFDLAIHDIDCARTLFGKPDEVTMPKYLAERFGLLLVDTCWKYTNGPVVRVEAGFMSPSTMPFSRDFTVIFENGALECDMSGLKKITSDGIENIELDGSDCYETEMISFGKALQQGNMDYACSGADATETIKLCRRLADEAGL